MQKRKRTEASFSSLRYRGLTTVAADWKETFGTRDRGVVTHYATASAQAVWEKQVLLTGYTGRPASP